LSQLQEQQSLVEEARQRAAEAEEGLREAEAKSQTLE
jgi:hypothetical protein